MSHMKILLIGGDGYIGNVVYDILKGYYDVDVLDCNLYNLHQTKQYINCDIRDLKELEKHIPKYEIIISLAAVVGDPACLQDKNLSLDVDYFGFKNIVDLVAKYNKFLLHLSTCSVYGYAKKIVNEEDDATPVDYYGMLKLAQEKLITSTLKQNFLLLRLGTVYGYSKRMRYDLCINSFIAQAINNEKINIFGGDQCRPFVEVRDVGLAVMYLLQNNKQGIYNVSGKNYTLLEIGSTISKELKCEVKVISETIDKRSYRVNDDKLLNIGFKYTYSVSDAINEIKNDESVKHYNDDIYHNVNLIKNLNKAAIEPKLIQGSLFADVRGYISCVNDFNFSNVKRFYTIRNHEDIIRGMHGHVREQKYLYQSSGSSLIILAKFDGKNIDRSTIKKFVLCAAKPAILTIPAKYVNSIRMLELNSQLIIFSSLSLAESQNDDIRFKYDELGEEIYYANNY